MKFQGEPSQKVRYIPNHMEPFKFKMIKFDESGIYETNDAKIIQRMKKKFKALPDAPQSPTIEVIDPLDTEPKRINCKACGGTHENIGEMLACSKKMKKSKR